MNRNRLFILLNTILIICIPVVINAACTDKDKDGYSIQGGDCGTVDCDDNNKNIYPGAKEPCGCTPGLPLETPEQTCNDTLDNDCDGKTDTTDLDCSPYKLTIVKDGNGGGTLSSAPKGINCGSDCTEKYAKATMVTLTVKPDANSEFGGWSGDCTGIKTSSKVNVNGEKACTATFKPKSYNLKVKLSGTGTGKVSSDREGIECGDGSNLCTTKYEYNTTVVLTATPVPDDEHSSFAKWTGCDSCTTSLTCGVTLSKAKKCKATFNAFYLKTKIKGSGKVTSEPSGINCGTDCAEKYAPNVQVMLAAEPLAGYDFAGWSLKGCPGTGTCLVTMNKAQSVTANFKKNGTLVAPTMAISYDPNLKNPVTDLADCIESVLACMNNQIALKDCFATEVHVCTSAVPKDGCCMRACGDQLTQELQSGSSEQDAFLKVFVYDGSCMPDL